MITTEEKLLNLKKKIEDAKTERAQFEGKLSLLYERLKELGCKSVENAEKQIKILKEEAAKLEMEVQNRIKEFEEKYQI